jgi:hypothetical protein
MKKIALMILFIMMLFACEKHKNFPENPDWLNVKISQMDTSAFYAVAIVYAYEWNREYYYLISNGLSSCAMCDFYNYQGEKVAWTDEKIADFQKNAKRIKVVWQGSFINN